MTPLELATLESVFSSALENEPAACQDLCDALNPYLREALTQAFAGAICISNGNALRAFICIFPSIYLKGVEAGKRIGMEEMLMGTPSPQKEKEKEKEKERVPKARKREFHWKGEEKKESYES